MAYLTATSKIPTKGKGSRLSPKQLAFVDEYFLDLNASKAVLRAGYKTNNPNRIGVELRRHPLVAREIEKRQSERRDKLEVKAEYLLSKLINIIEAEETKTPDQLRAIELAGKSIALWKERQEVSGPDGDAIRYEQKIKEDVAEFTSSIARLTQRGGKTPLSVVPDTGTEG